MGAWLQLPGVAVAFEAGMRRMNRSERRSSLLRPSALRLLMNDSSILPLTWAGMFNGRDCVGGSASRTPSPCISLFVTLIKSLRLELAEQRKPRDHRTVGYDPMLSPVPLQLLLEVIGKFTVNTRDVWDGKNRDAVRSSGSSTSDKVPSSLQVWLRLVLILLRSWVLLALEVNSHVGDASSDAFSSAQQVMMQNFTQDFRVGPDSLMATVLDTCGLHMLAVGRLTLDIRASHALWEWFASTHLCGRVLPACSRWGCTNLAGSSEAILPTQLCGGCRRVRYCSARCQRAAWVEEGHNVCCGPLAKITK